MVCWPSALVVDMEDKAKCSVGCHSRGDRRSYELINPGTFSAQIGGDLYVNPWWALHFHACLKAKTLVDVMTLELGQPDIWCEGWTPRLLWGPRDVATQWRPALGANLSGGNGQLWIHLWLPWRDAAFTLHLDVDPVGDLEGLGRYVKRLGDLPKIS